MSNLPWERLEGESLPAHAAALLYFEMGADRSCEAVAQQCTKSVSLIRRWSSRWSWVDRSKAYDAAMRAREAAHREAAQAAEATAWARKRAEEADVEWDLSRQLIEKARKMLAFPLQTEVVTHDGKQVTIHPARWSFRDIPATIEAAAKLARLAAGMETSRGTLQGPNGEAISFVMLVQSAQTAAAPEAVPADA